MPRRVIDQALCDRAARLARVHPLGVVADLLGLHPSQITRMRLRGWRAATHETMRRARPADFTIQSSHLSFNELCAHYRCGPSTLTRWLRETPTRRPSWKGRNLTREARATRAELG